MSEKEHFIIPIKYYIFTLVCLLFLTVLTVYTSKYWELGSLEIVLVLVIASTKALLVLAFFMGLRWDSGINIAFISYGIFFIFLFFSITFLDIATRDAIIKEEAGLQDIKTPVRIEVKK